MLALEAELASARRFRVENSRSREDRRKKDLLESFVVAGAPFNVTPTGQVGLNLGGLAMSIIGREQSRILRRPCACSIHCSSKYSSVPSVSRGDCPDNLSVIGLTKRVYQGLFALIAAAVFMKDD